MVVALAVTVLLGWSSCSSPKSHAPKLHKGKVIIAGHIQHFKGASRVISVQGEKLIGSIDKVDIIDSLGNFRMTFNSLYPKVVFINYENGLEALFTRPSDSLFVELDAQYFRKTEHPECRVSGPNARLSNEIQKYIRFSNHFENSLYQENEMKLPVPQFLKILKLKIQKGDSLIRVFDKTNQPGKKFNIWAKSNNLYGIANLLVYYMAYRQWHHIPYQHFNDLYDTILFPADNDKALISSLYIFYLYQYAQYQYMHLPEVSKLFKENKAADAMAIAIKTLLKNEKPGLSRDIMYYKLLANLHKPFLELMQRPDIYKGNKVLYAEMEQLYQQYSKPQYKMASFNKFTKKEEQITGNFMAQILKKYRGKVIYMDFWETYCGPCMYEFLYTHDLHNKFKGKQIAFVNVCMNSDMTNWKKKIKNMKITGDNYFLNSDQSKIFNSKQGVHSFPTYFIIDKNGYIVDRTAPRPSSKKTLYNELDKYLKQ